MKGRLGHILALGSVGASGKAYGLALYLKQVMHLYLFFPYIIVRIVFLPDVIQNFCLKIVNNVPIPQCGLTNDNI